MIDKMNTYAGKMSLKPFDSDIICNDYLNQYIVPFHIVKFESRKQIEAYEQIMCEGDDKTYMSWLSCQEKFTKFPCWIVCTYVHHSDSDDYTAVYMTLEEAKQDLLKAVKQLEELEQEG